MCSDEFEDIRFVEALLLLMDLLCETLPEELLLTDKQLQFLDAFFEQIHYYLNKMLLVWRFFRVWKLS